VHIFGVFFSFSLKKLKDKESILFKKSFCIVVEEVKELGVD